MTPEQAALWHGGWARGLAVARRLLASGTEAAALRAEAAEIRDATGDEDAVYWDEGVGVGIEHAIMELSPPAHSGPVG